MSTPSKSNAAAKSKPKRPLSGYNLFYRYKRNKILEATARPDHDNEAIIRAVLATPAGFEGVFPDSPVFRLPPAHLFQIRAAAIRKAMEGKIFPNENARNRVHCKVHGMGFVEMGRMMRQMWGRADHLTKDVFNELADVGRVRYRRLAAEYKLSITSAPAEDSSLVEKTAQTPTSIKSGEVEAAAISKGTRAVVADVFNPVKKEATSNLPATDADIKATAKPSPIPNQAQSSLDPMLEALSVCATKNPPAVAAIAVQSAEPQPKKKGGSRPSYGRRVSSDLDFQGPVPCQARSFGRSRGDLFEPLSFDATINPLASATVRSDTREKPSWGRRVSDVAAELDLCGDSLFEPLPVVTGDASATPKISDQPKWGRMVSTGHCPLPPGHNGMGGTITSNSAAGSSSNTHLVGLRTRLELQQIQLTNELKKIQAQMARNNSLLPPDMQVHAQDNVTGEKAYLDIMASRRPSLPNSTVPGSDNRGVGKEAKELRVSALDFMDFIGELDDAIDVEAIEKTEDLADADNVHGVDIDISAGAIGPEDGTAKASIEGNLDGIKDGHLTYIFGKPMFNMAGPIPMPADMKLKTNRARMA